MTNQGAHRSYFAKSCERFFLKAALALTLVGIVVIMLHIVRPRVVTKAVAPDGTVMCVVQELVPELFKTYFAYQKPGDVWRSFYHDHDDDYWGSAKVTLDTNAHSATFYRNGSPAIAFNWKTEQYTSYKISWTRPDGVRTNGWTYTNTPTQIARRWR